MDIHVAPYNLEALLQLGTLNKSIMSFLDRGSLVKAVKRQRIDFGRSLRPAVVAVLCHAEWDLESSEDGLNTFMRVHDESDVLVFCSVCLTGAEIVGYGPSMEAIDSVIAPIKSAILGKCDVVDNTVIARATFRDARGMVNNMMVRLAAPKWECIRDNYTQTVCSSMEALLPLRDLGSGRLIIWSGKPGTGKTYCIRALLNEWKDRYLCVVVLDSEAFLDNPYYYYSVMGDMAEEKPLLFVLEDSADGLLQESRAFKGSRVSAILNMTDGLLSQGREDLFLVTFNEQIRELDPAVVRPGRCLMQLQFDALSAEQSLAWMGERGSFSIEDREHTLAELYKIAGGGIPASSQELTVPLGFTSGGKG